MRAIILSLILLLNGAPPAQARRYVMEYQGALLGVVPLGNVTLDIDADESVYHIESSLRSGALLSLFERTRLTAAADGAIVRDGVAWSRYALDHFYARKHRSVEMTLAPEGVMARIDPTYPQWGNPPASEAQKRAARDPLSSLLAMSVDVARTRACGGAYLTFDGRFLYRLEILRGEATRFVGGNYQGQALRCRLRYVPIAGFEPRDAGRQRLPEGDIWFLLVADSPFAPPARVAASFGLVNVSLSLTRLQRPRVDVEEETGPEAAR